MENKKTTIAGFLTLGGALLSVVAAVLAGGDVGSAIMNGLLPALAGIGLIGARDGAV
tara:strand:+ start:1464 stop:1634 length:171 start_codon:yes stop_codon:yes gene_type:complete